MNPYSSWQITQKLLRGAASRTLKTGLLVLLLVNGQLSLGQSTLEQSRTPLQQPVLLVFGDSLSAGYGIDKTDGWVNLLRKKLKEENYPYQVINASVSGETTDGGLARLPALLDSYKPDLVMLELGGNDGLRGLPLKNIKENLLKMVDLAIDSGAEVLLAGIQIPPNYGPRYTEPFFDQYSEIAAQKNLPLVPFLIDGIPQQPQLMQDDGIHPRAEAQFMILDNVWPALEPVLNR